MKIKKLPTGNVSIILESSQEVNFLYALSNSSSYEVKQNALELGVDIGETEDFGWSFNMFCALGKIVEDSQ